MKWEKESHTSTNTLISFKWSFSNWRKLSERELRLLCKYADLAESDIRDIRAKLTHDLMEVRLWNGRRITYTGLQIYHWR